MTWPWLGLAIWWTQVVRGRLHDVRCALPGYDNETTAASGPGVARFGNRAVVTGYKENQQQW